MDIAEVKELAERFGILWEVEADWLISEHDRLTAELAAARQLTARWKQSSRRHMGNLLRVRGELAAAKEEIAKVWKLWEVNLDQMGKIGYEQVQGCRELTTMLVDQYEAMKTSLTSERKETDRLRGLLSDIGREAQLCLNHGITLQFINYALQKAALQSRQGEE